MGVSSHLDEVFMGYARLRVQTAGDHLFWEQGVWGALEQFVLGEVLPEDKAAVSANGPGSLHFYHRLMVLQAPFWDQG